MSAYVFAFVNARNLDWVAEYIEHVPPIVRSHGGKYVAVSRNMPNAVRLIEGTAPAPQGLTVLEFPSMEAAGNFMEDPKYAPYKKSRVEATESNFWAFENDPSAPQLSGQ